MLPPIPPIPNYFPPILKRPSTCVWFHPTKKSFLDVTVARERLFQMLDNASATSDEIKNIIANLSSLDFYNAKDQTPNSITTKGITPSMVACVTHSQLVEKLAKNESAVTRLWEKQKLLAHRWSLSNKVQVGEVTASLEAFFPEITNRAIVESLKKFIHTEEFAKFEMGIPYEAKVVMLQYVIDTLENLFKHQAEVKNGKDLSKTSAFAVGWFGHATGLLNEALFMKLNRGEHSAPYPGISIFEVEHTDKIREAAKKSIDLKGSKAGEKWFTEEIDTFLGLKLYHRIRTHYQSVGNCCWATGKLKPRGLLYHYMDKVLNMDKATSEKYSTALGKLWSTWDRKDATIDYDQSVKEYLRSIPPGFYPDASIIDKELLTAIASKSYKWRYFNVLEYIFVHRPDIPVNNRTLYALQRKYRRLPPMYQFA